MERDGERPAGGAGRGGAPRWLAGVPRRILILASVVVAVLVVIAVVKIVGDARGLIAGVRGRTTLTQEMVVQEMRAVAKLVSSEMTVRDVVTYENTRYGSTKRALIVVTGKISAGIDLERGTEVRIDSSAKHITIIMPEAQVLSVDILQLRTYDEQRGLWNPFQPEDRDAIYQNVRRQLHRAAADMGIVARANASAARMLETMFSVDGYTTEVRFGAPAPALDGPVLRDTASNGQGGTAGGYGRN
jgi:hypothetical protein